MYAALVRDSLRLDKELHDRIDAKVKARGGTVMPMEYGMLVGVERAFRIAGVEFDSVDANARPGWTKGGAYGRFKALSLDGLYRPH